MGYTMSKLIKAPKGFPNWLKTVIAVVLASFTLGASFAGFLPLKAKAEENTKEIIKISKTQAVIINSLKERSADIKEIKKDVKLLLMNFR